MWNLKWDTNAPIYETRLPGGSDCKKCASEAGDPGSPLEKEMATHSSILAWKIPWMRESHRPQSMGLQRVGRN